VTTPTRAGADAATAAAKPAGREPAAEDELLARLRAGDEAAFAGLVDAWSRPLLRVARGYVSTDASAQEVVQDTWLAVVRGLDAFEGRSSLQTWVYRILINTAKSRGVRERRVLLVASFGPQEETGPTVDPARFRGADEEWAHHWTAEGAPTRWDGDPVAGALRGEIRALLDQALSALPERQRVVVVLRDVEGRGPEEVCEVLGLTAENQRVLLHRGRAKVRAALEDYYRGGST